LTMATITKLRIRLAAVWRKKRTAQFNNITSLGYYVLEKIGELPAYREWINNYTICN
jgi:hypothetical protein